MAEKTRFSDLMDQPAPKALPEKCCGHCTHARAVKDLAQVGRAMFQCRAFPPIPILVVRNGQPMVQSMWPVLDSAEECDAFALPMAQNAASN